MFLVTQFIGLYVVNHYLAEENNLPYGMDQPEIESNAEYLTLFPFIIIAFIIAITIMFFMSKFNLAVVLRLWFFIVVAIALGLSFNAILSDFSSLTRASIIAFVIALPLAYIKIFKQNFLIHNATELFIYPGIAAVFVPLLNLYTIIAFLIIISIYDAWAVWHSGFMQKMATYQIKKLNIFGGFLVPSTTKAMKAKIKKMKLTMSKKQLSKKNIKVNVAILGGGDVIFPIITAGVMLKLFTFYHSLFVIAGATLGLGFLLMRSEKKKFYPAMPFITAGIFIGMIASYFIL